MLRRTQPISNAQVKAPQDAERRGQPPAQGQEAAPEAKKTGPYGVDRRIDPRLKFDKPASTRPAEPAAPAEEDRRVHPRIKLETSNTENERRERQRRHTEAMRAQLQRTMPKESKPTYYSRLAERFGGMSAIKPSRILLLAVALITGGFAAYLASRLDGEASKLVAEPAVEIVAKEVVAEPRTQILVAKQNIGIGQRLTAASIGWEDWPEGSIRADYVSVEATPQAVTEMSGALARFEIFPGEPIRLEKLVLGDQGYLSAVLGAGLRGVSVLVSAQSAAGGFVVPNDHVDVMMVAEGSGGLTAQTILQNVRVLAINSRLGETGATGAPPEESNGAAGMFTNDAIATLEVNKAEAELLVAASQGGSLALVLRSMVDFGDRSTLASANTNQAIRLTSPFWTGEGAVDVLR